MDKDKLNEIETLIDGIKFDLQDLRNAAAAISEKVGELEQVLSANVEEF